MRLIFSKGKKSEETFKRRGNFSNVAQKWGQSPTVPFPSEKKSEPIRGYTVYIYIYIYVYYIYIYIYVYYIYGFSTATEKVLTLRSDSDKILGNFLDSVPLVLIIVVVILVAVITTFVYSTI